MTSVKLKENDSILTGVAILTSFLTVRSNRSRVSASENIKRHSQGIIKCKKSVYMDSSQRRITLTAV